MKWTGLVVASVVGGVVGWIITVALDAASAEFGYWIVGAAVVTAAAVAALSWRAFVMWRAKRGPQIPWPPPPPVRPAAPERPAGIEVSGPGTSFVGFNSIDDIPDTVTGVRVQGAGDSQVVGNSLRWRRRNRQ